MSASRIPRGSIAAGLGLGRPAWLLVAACLSIATPVATTLAAPLQAQTATDDGPLAGAAPLGWVHGSASSQITVVEFTDVSCPYCASFHEGTRAGLLSEYVDSGKVQWITLTYISGLYPNSEAVSVAAECAGRQGKYDAFMTAVYEARDDWVDASSSVVAETIQRIAGSTELDGRAFQTCTDDPAVLQRLDDVRSLASETGVRGTPTWFVDGFLVMGDLPLGYARSFIERRLPSGR